MKNHLKRIAAPKTWSISRKTTKFVTKANPGSHSQLYGMPLVIYLRDHLNLAESSSQTKTILKYNDVLVNGKKQKDIKNNVGLFDILSIPQEDGSMKTYRVVLAMNGKLSLQEGEFTTRLVKITGKKMLKGGKMQLNFHNGGNLLTSENYMMNSTLELSISDSKVVNEYKLEKSSNVFLISGKHTSELGVIKEFVQDRVIYQRADNKEVETKTSYAFVVPSNDLMVVSQ